MARSVVELIIAAKDSTGAAIRSARANLRGFFGEASKFAAGLGIFDSFKQLGKFLFQAAKDAAQAVPELAAPFDAVRERWEKVRLEIGAGALQLGVPIAHFAIDVLDQFKGLTQAIIEEWFKLPARFDEALGRIQQSLGEFLADSQVVLARLGIDTGDLGERIANAGASKVRAAIRTRGDLTREFATPDREPSVIDRALAAKAAREAEERQAKREQLLARIAATGQATQGELDQLVEADAALARQLEATNLTLERRAQLIERQRGVRGAIQGVADRLTGPAPAPRAVARGGEQEANRRAEVERLAAAERGLQAQLAAGNLTAVESLELQDQLRRVQADRLVLLQQEGGILASRAGMLTQDIGTQQLAREEADRRAKALEALAVEERALQDLLADGTRAVDERVEAEERLAAIERERLGLRATALPSPDVPAGDPQMGEAVPTIVERPRSEDPLALENLLTPEQIELIPAGAGEAAAEEIGVVRSALIDLALKLDDVTEEGWAKFGRAASKAAEQSFKAEQNVGKAAVAAGKSAIAGVARAKSADAFISAGHALATGLMGNPASFAAAAQFTAAGTAWAALASQLGGGGGGSRGGGGGGGGGGANGGLSDSRLDKAREGLGATVVFKVPRQGLIDPNSPEYQDMQAKALEQAGFRNIVFEPED